MALELNGTTGVSLVQDGVIQTTDIDDGAVTTAKIASSTLVGTVSESSGTPTGAIIERGSNANGEFVKYADGTMICTNRNTITPVANTFTAYTWTYPGGSFIQRPIVSVTGNSGVEAVQNAQCADFASDHSTVDVGLVRSNTANTELHSIAVGRWY